MIPIPSSVCGIITALTMTSCSLYLPQKIDHDTIQKRLDYIDEMSQKELTEDEILELDAQIELLTLTPYTDRIPFGEQIITPEAEYNFYNTPAENKIFRSLQEMLKDSKK